MELADGRKLLSQGQCPHTLLTVSTKNCKVDLTICPLMKNIDVILGINWLQMTQPLIDWSVPRLLLPGSEHASTVIGRWLESTIPVGQVSVLRDSVRPSLPVPPSPLASGLEVLRRPTFWAYASSGNAWARSSPRGGVAGVVTLSTQDKTDQVHQEHVNDFN